MDLKNSKNKIKQSLLQLVKIGTDLRDTIEKEYRLKRSSGTFDRGKDIVIWSKLYSDWYRQCEKKINENFEQADLIINRFRNPEINPFYPSGENIEWATLMKNFNARLAILDELYQSVDDIKEEEIIKLSPELYGVGINFKPVWRKIKNLFKKN